MIRRQRFLVQRVWRSGRATNGIRREAGHYTFVHNQPNPPQRVPSTSNFRVATYNVHRWSGMTGGNRYMPELAADVIRELDADVLGLQEVLRPFGPSDPLIEIAQSQGFHLAFVCTRYHRRGDLGNAILSRWPIASVFAMNLSFGRLEQRSALAAILDTPEDEIAVVATHLALLDLTRRRQVQSLLRHPRLEDTVVLLGDMNAWRRCSATRQLDRELTSLHNNSQWPPSFPVQRPVLALDRIYARGAYVENLSTFDSPTARRASDHLPVLAHVRVNGHVVETPPVRP
ncbi:MAG TPA: endonuclease/exonuclease/phosphatase family protein [Rhodothermales bacterium]